MRFLVVATILGMVLPGAALAQSSPSFKVAESGFSSGGHPAAGASPSSAGFELSLGSIGDAASPQLVSGPSFRVEGGFVAAYAPPGEVLQLRTPTKTTLQWNADRSAGNYQLYRDGLTELPGSGYGLCLIQNLTGTTATDTNVPTRGRGYFYLVTAENRLGEEGIKGFDSQNNERKGNVCP